jgi:hypothetical protein
MCARGSLGWGLTTLLSGNWNGVVDESPAVFDNLTTGGTGMATTRASGNKKRGDARESFISKQGCWSVDMN